MATVITHACAGRSEKGLNNSVNDVDCGKLGNGKGEGHRLLGNFVKFLKRIWRIGELPDDHPIMKWRDWPYWWT